MIDRSRAFAEKRRLILPIAIMIMFGFNDTHSKQNFQWQGFTLKWYVHLFDKEDLTTAVINSLTIALLSTAITTVIGTFAGIALGRHRFRGKGVTNLVLFMAIAFNAAIRWIERKAAIWQTGTRAGQSATDEIAAGAMQPAT